MNFQNKKRTLKLVQLALLFAVEIMFAFTPLGYLRVGVIEITFMSIPVAIGAMLLGPLSGLSLGTVFGITSFVQCFGISAFGTVLFGISPWRTFFLCLIPRMLMGYLSGLVFSLLKKRRENSILAFGASAFSAAFLNTVFFVLAFFSLFRNATLDLGGVVFSIGDMNLWDVVIFLAGLNGFVEVIACTAIATPIGRALSKVLKQ